MQDLQEKNNFQMQVNKDLRKKYQLLDNNFKKTKFNFDYYKDLHENY